VSIKKEELKPSRNTVKHQRRSTQVEGTPRLGNPSSSIKNTISTIVEERNAKVTISLRDSSKKKYSQARTQVQSPTHQPSKKPAFKTQSSILSRDKKVYHSTCNLKETQESRTQVETGKPSDLTALLKLNLKNVVTGN